MYFQAEKTPEKNEYIDDNGSEQIVRGKNAVWLMEFVVNASENNIRYFFP